jgi:hypothetical protein
VLWPFIDVTKVVGVPGSETEDEEESEPPPHAYKPIAAKASRTIDPMLLLETLPTMIYPIN